MSLDIVLSERDWLDEVNGRLQQHRIEVEKYERLLERYDTIAPHNRLEFLTNGRDLYFVHVNKIIPPYKRTHGLKQRGK